MLSNDHMPREDMPPGYLTGYAAKEICSQVITPGMQKGVCCQAITPGMLWQQDSEQMMHQQYWAVAEYSHTPPEVTASVSVLMNLYAHRIAKLLENCSGQRLCVYV